MRIYFVNISSRFFVRLEILFLSISITSQRKWETKLAAVLLQRVSVKTGRDQSRIVPARSST